MKNFRKVLALILVVATLFSFVAMASAKTAADYSDAADIKYVEAVDVLSAIGITEGYDGAFHANDPIDRDEVAAMVARLRNGGTVDADLYVGADNVFADVKGQWSEGYVTYCAQLGIIDGYNATTFAPDAPVKGIEVLKMLLCVLGYDADEQGYVGANWQVNVVRDATKMDLLIDGVDVYVAATRDEVAQYFLNALKSKMVVGYLGEGLVKLTNSIWIDLSEGLDGIGKGMIEVIEPDSEALKGHEITYCNAVIANDRLWESIPDLKFDDVTAATDCYGRPGYVWSFGKDFKKFYALTPDASVTSGFSVLAYADEIDDGYKFVSYLDGFYMDEADGVGVLDLETGAGNGVLTEVYVLDDAETVLIVSKSTYIAEVDYINSYNGAVTLIDEAGATVAVVDDPGVELEVGDMVLFSVCNGGYNHGGEAPEVTGWLETYYYEDLLNGEELYLHEMEIVEPVVATIEYGHIYDDINKSNVTASGKTYSYNVNYVLMYDSSVTDIDDVDAAQAAAVIDYTEVADDAEYDLYLDAYGNIIWAEPHTTTPEYFYAYVEPGMSAVLNGINLGDRQDITADTTITGSLVNFTGKGGEVKAEKTTVDANLWNTMFVRGADYEMDFTMNDDDFSWAEASGVGMLIRYTKDEDGNFVFVNGDPVDAIENPAVIGEDIGYYAAPGAKLSKEASWKLDDGVYADGDTVFMIRTPDGKYTEVVGYENLDRDYMAETVIGLGGTAFTNIQYFVDGTYADVDEDGHDVMFATYVFINAKYTKAAANHFLVIDDQEFYAFDLNIADVYKNNYFAYTALVDGVKSIVLVGEEFANNDEYKIEVGSLYKGAIELIDTTCCPEHKLPIYVYAEEVKPNVDGDPIHDNYLRKDSKGNVWVCASDVLDSNPGEYAIAKLAKDAKIYTILVEQKLTGSDVIDDAKLPDRTVISVQEQTDAIMNVADAEMEVEYGWILWNSTETEITAIYRITDSFAD